MKELVKRLRKAIKNHEGLGGTFVRTKVTKRQLKNLLDAVERAGMYQAEADRLQKQIWDRSSRQMEWYRKHGYCHTGDHYKHTCPGDHGK